MSTPGNPDSEDRLRAVLAELWPEVLAYAHRRLPRDPGQAEELVQDAAVDLIQRWRQRGEFPISRAVAMMKQSIKCDLRNLWAKQCRQRTDLAAVDDKILLDYLERTTGHDNEILALLSRIDAQRRVPQLLDLLTAQQRAAIVAVHIDGTTQAQAAAELGITERALQARLKNAHEVLRRHADDPTIRTSATQTRWRPQR
ncbi:RNA polymerase sigma factor [Kutzneria sp. NPDC052558]|uniref:RNA polymerase sigma factor n=1 Tax=Kutzneria sp. NPDC052558 TaxID=3364121 RepID=UPI0037C9CEAA